MEQVWISVTKANLKISRSSPLNDSVQSSKVKQGKLHFIQTHAKYKGGNPETWAPLTERTGLIETESNGRKIERIWVFINLHFIFFWICPTMHISDFLLQADLLWNKSLNKGYIISAKDTQFECSPIASPLRKGEWFAPRILVSVCGKKLPLTWKKEHQTWFIFWV